MGDGGGNGGGTGGSAGSFWDFKSRVEKQRRGRVAPIDPNAANPADVLSVSQITAIVERAISQGVPARVLVRGEASGVKLHPASGHLYLTLKDDSACIDCIMYRRDVSNLRVMPESGIEVIATGQVRVYPPRGSYQLYCEAIEPVGRGAFELAFRQTLARLTAEGLLEPSRKKPLPMYPRRIAMVTSRSTAALRDMLKVLRRYPFLQLFLFHVPVQGDGAAAALAAAIGALTRGGRGMEIDLILLGRGGGSPEDLWAFNDESLARAIVACTIPIITGIGHEVDTSIADLVADHHAHTPTEAAQVAVANWRTAITAIDTHGVRLRRGLRQMVETARQRLRVIERHESFRYPLRRIDRLRQLLDERQRALVHAAARRCALSRRRAESVELRWARRHPGQRIALAAQKLGDLDRRLRVALSATFANRTKSLDAAAARMGAASIQGILNRGFSITRRRADGRIVRGVSEAKTGHRLITQVADGNVASVVEDQRQGRLF